MFFQQIYDKSLAIMNSIMPATNAVDFKTLISEGAIIVDVRTPEEFLSGHIKGSTNIPLGEIKNKTAMLKAMKKTIITCCRSGSRSEIGKSILESKGIECYNGGSWGSLENKIL